MRLDTLIKFKERIMQRIQLDLMLLMVLGTMRMKFHILSDMESHMLSLKKKLKAYSGIEINMWSRQKSKLPIWGATIILERVRML